MRRKPAARPPLRSRPLFRSLLLAVALLLPTTGFASGATAAGIAPDTASAAAPTDEVHGLKGEYFSMSAPGARDFAD
ncbi:hypothetical protein, partial [Streptomyces niveus]